MQLARNGFWYEPIDSEFIANPPRSSDVSGLETSLRDRLMVLTESIIGQNMLWWPFRKPIQPLAHSVRRRSWQCVNSAVYLHNNGARYADMKIKVMNRLYITISIRLRAKSSLIAPHMRMTDPSSPPFDNRSSFTLSIASSS